MIALILISLNKIFEIKPNLTKLMPYDQSRNEIEFFDLIFFLIL